MQHPIETPQDFFRRIVKPDCIEALKDPGDIRKVMHACMSLHHLREWVYKSGITDYRTEKEFYDHIYGACPKLQDIKSFAVNSKHPQPTTVAPMTIATSATNILGWGLSWGKSFSGWKEKDEQRVIAKSKNGSSLWIEKAVKEAYDFWNHYIENIR